MRETYEIAFELDGTVPRLKCEGRTPHEPEVRRKEIGIELVPNQPQTAPVVTWNGWHQFLLQKILLEPDATCSHLGRLLVALKIPMALTRDSFPASPSPQAHAKEARFRTAVHALAPKYMAATGSGGAAAGGMDVHSQAAMLAASRMRKSMASSMANSITLGGMNMMNASSSESNMWYMSGR